MKKIIATVLVFLSISLFCTAQSLSSADAANRRTALRCLNSASYSASKNFWSDAISDSELGISYDDKISDLWYINAVAKTALGYRKADVLPLVENALEINNWVDYNRDGARVLYADILCDTRRFDEVSGILDASPLLYSADAEFIRAKAYYRMGTQESVKKAREKIDSARRIYPDDTRFPLLFFKNESPLDTDASVKKMTEFFVKQISQYVEASPDKDAELEIYAAMFAEGKDKEHLLKSFSARGLKHVLYPRVALESGLIKEEKAFDYFVSFADKGIALVELENFLSLLTEASVIKKAQKYFNAFDGILLVDTDSDGIYNMYIKYLRGRPSDIGYDEGQDEIIDWKIDCDFGLPVKCNVTKNNTCFEWDSFPYLKSVVYKNENDESKYVFNLVSESFGWTPIFMTKNEILSEILSLDFFAPVVNPMNTELEYNELLSVSSGFELADVDDGNVRIKFVLLNGEVTLSRYYKKGMLFAQCQFDSNIPVMRIVDSDGDGVFETTEFYAVDSENKYQIHSLEEERIIMQSLFGVPSNDAGFYLKLIQIDRDGNTVADFTEEYLPDQGKITSWDNDEDGLWEVRYVNYGKSYDAEGKPLQLHEESMFYEKPNGNLVVIQSVDGVPVSVKTGDETFSVEKDPLYNFYWIGNTTDSLLAEKCLQFLGVKNVQGESEIVEYNGKRVLCVQIGGMSFGQVITY